MAASKAILHATWDSSCVYRVRICLSFKGIPYDIKPIKKTKTGYEIKVDDRDLNPTNLVPVLQIDGHSLIESVAIMEYLEETRPEPALLPKDFHKRAQVRAFCDIIMSGIQPMQNSGPLRLVSKYTDGNEMEWIHHWINKGFAALEKLLLSHAGKYCVGDEITLADCCLVPMVLNARRYNINLSPYPSILRIDHTLQRNPAFRRAHPAMQFGFPDEMRTDPNFILSPL